MKSLYIITGGILVMVAIVFFTSQKQNNPEGKASGQLDEIDAIVLEQFGDNLTPEEKKIARKTIAEEFARDKAEMRKYGRLLTDEERSAQWWREQDEAEEKAAYAKLYEERKDWIDNFPFQPRYHQNIVYDLENNIAHSTENFHAYKKELEKKADEAIQNPDPELMEQRRMFINHNRLQGFYGMNWRYSPEFEQAYRIFEEEGLADNPIRIAHTMATLEMYKEASLQYPDELHQYFEGPMEGKKGNHPYTNQQFLDRSFHWLTGTITFEGNLMPGETPPKLDQARLIAKRLAEEIPPEGFLSMDVEFGYWQGIEQKMQPGQSLLAE